jgi:hypothetical protein
MDGRDTDERTLPRPEAGPSGNDEPRVKTEFSATPPPRRAARAGVAHRHRDHAGERALTTTTIPPSSPR